MDTDTVQYIIVRKDLNMSHGKMAVQVAHASIASVYPYLDDIYVQEWLNNKFTKIILQVKSLEGLKNLIRMLMERDIIYKNIVDDCTTELSKETDKGTLTCVGIKPYPKYIISDLLSIYRLYS